MAEVRRKSPALPAPEFARRLDEGVGPVVVLAGAERWFREEGLRQVVARVLPDGDPGGALLRYDARRAEDRSGVSGAIDELRSSSLFAGGKVVAVDYAEAAVGPWAKGPKSPIRNLVEAALAAPVAGSVLVLLTPRPVRGQSPIPTAALVKAGALVVDCRALYDAPGSWQHGVPAWDHELARYLSARMQEVHGRRLERPDAHALTRLVGSGLSDLDASLETLALYLGEKQTVDSDDVHEALGATRSDPAWKLTDAVADRDVSRAFDWLEAAFTRGIPDGRGGMITAADSIFVFVTASLHSSWRRLLAGAEGLARGEPPEEVARAAGIPPFRAREWLGRCRRDPADLLARHAAFLEAEAGVKGGLAPPRLALERLVARLVT